VAIRVRVRISVGKPRSGQKTLETVAVANSGFEAPQPEIVLPARAAERLGFWPRLPAGARTERFESPAGELSMATIRDACRVVLSTHPGNAVPAHAVISPNEVEVILNDHLVEALEIELLRPASGLYRVGASGLTQQSEPPERW
jgi:hypothetical protein